MTREERIEKMAAMLSPHLAARDATGWPEHLAASIVDALDEPIRVTDELLVAVQVEYFRAAGITGRDGMWLSRDHLRAALEAALQAAPQTGGSVVSAARGTEDQPEPECEAAPRPGPTPRGARHSLEQECDDVLTQLAMREAECEWLRRVETAARKVDESAHKFGEQTDEPFARLHKALQDLDGDT